MVKLRVPPAARARLKQLGGAAPRAAVYVVGGCVRDWILGRPTKDLDLVVEGDPAPLVAFALKRFGGRAEAFGEFGTHRIFFKDGDRLDVARARRESYPSPAALPVVEPAPLIEDLKRRDFTLNALAVRIASEGLGAVEDPWGGVSDLEHGLLRVLHPASFRDDPTRVFRAARFLARFGFALELDTERRLQDCVAEGQLFLLSRERVRAELLRILEEKNPERALALLQEWGALSAVFHRFTWDAAFARPRSPLVRLGLLALQQHGAGRGNEEAFLDSLHLERASALALKEAAQAAARRQSPRATLPDLAAKVLAAAGVPSFARRALLVNGKDLMGLGLEPGEAFSDILERAARAQWAGEFKTRAQALKWLKATAPHNLTTESAERAETPRKSET